MIGVLFVLGSPPSVLSAFLDTISPKKGTDVLLKLLLSLFSFRFTCLHICSTFHSLSSWSLPLLLYPTTKMSSAMANTFCKSLNILSLFHWNTSPEGTALSNNLLYLYMPNLHENAVRYYNLSSSPRL